MPFKRRKAIRKNNYALETDKERPKGPLNQIEALAEYCQNKWAYYYAFPEYFTPEKFPPLVGEYSTLAVRHDKVLFNVDTSGQFCVYFCPGAPLLKNIQHPMPVVSVIQGMKFCSPLTVPGEGHASWGKGKLLNPMKRTRIVGGYIKVSTISNVTSGIFRYAPFTRGSTYLPSTNLNDHTLFTQKGQSQNFLTRYRCNEDHPKYDEDTNQTVFHLIYGTAFIPNTLIEIEVEISYEIAGFSTSGENERSTISRIPKPLDAMRKASSLNELMPETLSNQPLTNPVLYPVIFEGDFVEDKCFVEKNSFNSVDSGSLMSNWAVANNNIHQSNQRASNNTLNIVPPNLPTMTQNTTRPVVQNADLADNRNMTDITNLPDSLKEACVRYVSELTAAQNNQGNPATMTQQPQQLTQQQQQQQQQQRQQQQQQEEEQQNQPQAQVPFAINATMPYAQPYVADNGLNTGVQNRIQEEEEDDDNANV
jgi:hypothetical protein